MEEALLEYETDAPQPEPVDLSLVKDLARKAYTDAIPELIDGDSVAAIMGSVDGARAAYARVFADVEGQHAEHRSRPPVVPAGGSKQAAIDVERLPASEKLRLGVGAARR